MVNSENVVLIIGSKNTFLFLEVLSPGREGFGSNPPLRKRPTAYRRSFGSSSGRRQKQLPVRARPRNAFWITTWREKKSARPSKIALTKQFIVNRSHVRRSFVVISRTASSFLPFFGLNSQWNSREAVRHRPSVCIPIGIGGPAAEGLAHRKRPGTVR